MDKMKKVVVSLTKTQQVISNFIDELAFEIYKENNEINNDSNQKRGDKIIQNEDKQNPYTNTQNISVNEKYHTWLSSPFF